MTDFETFQRLARAARQEPVPRLDVAARVLRTVRAAERPREVELPLLLFSALSVVAASIVCVLAVRAWSPADPVSDLVQLTTVMLQ